MEIRKNFILAFGNEKSYIETLKKFSRDLGELIPYKDLRAIPIGEEFEINNNPNIKTVRLDTKHKNSLSFRVRMEANEVWSLHKHDCHEAIIIYNGRCVDEVNEKTIDKGNLYFISPFIKHKIRAKENGTIFYVEFKNPDV